MPIPTNASINDASIKISGLPYGLGELDDYNKASIGTNGGSTSPSVSMLDDDYYVAWIDDGDLNERDTSIDSVNLDTMMAIGMT